MLMCSKFMSKNKFQNTSRNETCFVHLSSIYLKCYSNNGIWKMSKYKDDYNTGENNNYNKDNEKANGFEKVCND